MKHLTLWIFIIAVSFSSCSQNGYERGKIEAEELPLNSNLKHPSGDMPGWLLSEVYLRNKIAQIMASIRQELHPEQQAVLDDTKVQIVAKADLLEVYSRGKTIVISRGFLKGILTWKAESTIEEFYFLENEIRYGGYYPARIMIEEEFDNRRWKKGELLNAYNSDERFFLDILDMIVAHELGHVFLQHATEIRPTIPEFLEMEMSADLFASFLSTRNYGPDTLYKELLLIIKHIQRDQYYVEARQQIASDSMSNRDKFKTLYNACNNHLLSILRFRRLGVAIQNEGTRANFRKKIDSCYVPSEALLASWKEEVMTSEQGHIEKERTLSEIKEIQKTMKVTEDFFRNKYFNSSDYINPVKSRWFKCRQGWLRSNPMEIACLKQ